MKLERFGCGLEVKFAPDEANSKTGVFSGYGAVFGNKDAYGDVIKKGAFKATLKEWRAKKKYPPMLLQHGGGFFGGGSDDLVPIGKWTSMEEDEKGLYVEGELLGLSTDRGVYIYEGMKAGVLDGMSIGYIAREVEYGKDPEDAPRTIKKIDLIELSVVTFPANDEARVDAVKATDITERDFERWLMRDAGFTRSEAIIVINEGFKALRRSKRDAGVADAKLAAGLRSMQAALSNLKQR